MSARRRDCRIDVARGLLILGVVVGHLLERSGGWDGGVLRLALTGLYAMHMPAFIFLTGFLAKPTHTATKVLGLLSLVACFQIVFSLFLAAAGYPLKEWYWPYWVLWYIMAMIWWQLLTPLITRWPVIAFFVSCVAALFIGFAEPQGSWFAYQRAIQFLPFFVAGCAWGQGVIGYLRTLHLPMKAGLATVFAVAVVGVFIVNPDQHWLFHSWTYAQLGADALTGIMSQLCVLLVGALGTAVLLSLIPSKQRVLSWIGQRTLPIFIFHVIPVLLYGWFIAPRISHVPGSIVLMIGIMLGVGITGVCALQPFVVTTTVIRTLPQRLLTMNKARGVSAQSTP